MRAGLGAATRSKFRPPTPYRRPEKYRETVRHEIDYVRREAERLAEKYRLNAADIIAEAEAILKERP